MMWTLGLVLTFVIAFFLYFASHVMLWAGVWPAFDLGRREADLAVPNRHDAIHDQAMTNE